MSKYIDSDVEILIKLNFKQTFKTVCKLISKGISVKNPIYIKGIIDSDHSNSGVGELAFLSEDDNKKQRIIFHYEDNKWVEKMFIETIKNNE